MKPLKTIIFIDDNRGDNYYHSIVVEDAGIKAKVETFQLAEQALAYLKEVQPGTVDLIFLDINMPRMDGFEFLDIYSQLNGELKGRKGVIVMLTTSFNPADQIRAKKYTDVKGFYNKPLTQEIIQGIINENFIEH